MQTFENGSTLKILRDGTEFVVEYRSGEGVLIDSVPCETFEQAQFCVDIGPARW